MKAGTGNGSLGWLFMAGNYTMPILSFPPFLPYDIIDCDDSINSNFLSFAFDAAARFLRGWGGVDFFMADGDWFCFKVSHGVGGLGAKF